MRTEHEIYMDFRLAMEQARRLRNIAQSMGNLADGEVGRTLNNIESQWIGENSGKYVAKGRRVIQRIHGTRNDVLKVAQAIEQIARNTRDAELRAIAIAKG